MKYWVGLIAVAIVASTPVTTLAATDYGKFKKKVEKAARDADDPKAIEGAKSLCVCLEGGADQYQAGALISRLDVGGGSRSVMVACRVPSFSIGPDEAQESTSDCLDWLPLGK